MPSCTCARTMGLGGFSSHDASFGFWNSRDIEAVAIVFMALSGISFARYFIVWRARSLFARCGAIPKYATYVVGAARLRCLDWPLCCGCMALLPEPLDALRAAAFHVVSLATTTGYASTDYALWPVFAPVWLMFLGTFVSCAGSTGGGIKMVRMVLLIKQSRRELVRVIHPRVVNPVTLGRRHHSGHGDRRGDGLHADLWRQHDWPDHAAAALGAGHRHGVSRPWLPP